MKLFATVAMLCLVNAPGAMAAESTIIAWEFNTPGQLEGWQPNGHLKDTAVADGVMRTTAVDWDPFLTSRQFDIPALPWQCIEFRIKADKPGKGQFFWTNTLKSKYAGFFPKKTTHFELRGDGKWETVRIYPFWHCEKKIILMRFDVYDAATFEVDYVRVIEPASTAPTDKTAWEFESGAEGWAALDSDASLQAGRGTIDVRTATPLGRIIAPRLEVPVDGRFWVSVRMTVGEPGQQSERSHGRVWFASDAANGLLHKDFVVKADGRVRTYNVDMTPCPQWQGRILALGLTPVRKSGGRASIDSIMLAEDPTGPPLIELSHFGLADGINRAGLPAQVIATVHNAGGGLAEGLTATLQVPDGVELVGPAATQKFAPLELLCYEDVKWTVRSSAAQKSTFALTLEGPGVPTGPARASLEFTRPLGLPKASYVPEPQPVPCKYDVGVFYFPGWKPGRHYGWEKIAPFPGRKPLLGWYDEGRPEIADWQIKWAVEHGVKFFMLDWYWCQGGQHLEHWLHDAYMKAKYRKYLKWCVMWANHSAPNSHSAEDWRRVTQYWIDHFFGMEEYYRIDDRPAVYIWAPRNIRRDLGGSPGAAKLYAMSQKMARDAGYKGIYFVAMSSHRSAQQCQELKAEGYEAFTSYHGFGPAQRKAGTRFFPFKLVVDTAAELWADCDQRTDMLYMPIVDTGWSSEPWHGERALVIHSRTPKLFGEMCRQARHYADKTGKKIISIGPWNEWGEGSYIEPYAEHGFAMLDELRAAFCEPGSYPRNIAPVDVGLGPYDEPMRASRFETAWGFDTDGDLQGWRASMGLNRVRAEAGRLKAVASTRDPAFGSPPLRVHARQWPKLRIRMKATGTSKDDQCQLFWSTPTSNASGPASIRLELVPDVLHDYVFDLTTNPRWRGLIIRLRFDPSSTQGASVEIDEVRFEK